MRVRKRQGWTALLFTVLGVAFGLFAATGLARAQGKLHIEGSAALLARIAVPAGAELVVELTEASGTDTIAETRVPLAGRRPPIPFTLDVDPARLPAQGNLAVRAGLVIEGRLRFVSAARSVSRTAGTILLGELVLHPHQSLAFVTDLVCGDRIAAFGMDGDTPTFILGEARYPLKQVEAASGSRFEGVDAKVVFWSKDEAARLELPDGTTLDCRKAGRVAPASDRLVARGNEPSWRLTIDDSGASLTSLSPELAFAAPSVVRTTVDGGPRITASSAGRTLAVTVKEGLCADTMTGMPFPFGVSLDLDGKALSGCGGETLDLLAGGWRVIRLGDAPVPQEVTITIEFGRDGRVAGRGGCNRYSGPYTLTGEGLSFGDLVSTRMACPQPQMEAEARFLGLLAKVTRATPGEAGQLKLMAGDEPAAVLDRAR